jgi:glycerophosphoryl diester phosphodiesterase
VVKVLGHRGARQRADVDENSLPAFRIALEQADGLEADAVISADKTVFLQHESGQRGLHPRLKHIAWKSVYGLKNMLDAKSAKSVGERRLDQLSDKEIDSLRLAKGSKLPRLSELFNLAAQHPGKTINIELKGEDMVEAVLKEINSAVDAGKIRKEQVILTSFNHPAIAKVKQLEPGLKTGLIFSRNPSIDPRMFPWSCNKESRYVHFNRHALRSKRVRDIAPDFFVLNAEAVTAKNVALIRKRFPAAKIMFWMSDEPQPEKNEKLMKMLADNRIAPVIEAVISDHPAEMAKMLKARGLKI